MSKTLHPVLKAAAVAVALFSIGAQARPFMPEPTGRAPADHMATEYPQWSPEVALRAKRPATPLAAPAMQSNEPAAPRVGTVEAQQRAKYPWLYRGN